MPLPRVAITVGSKAKVKDYGEYVDRVVEAGGEPVIVWPGFSGAALSDLADCLLVSGGADVAPQRYGEEPVPEVEVSDLGRDETEARLLELAFMADAPVLAICRGHQMLNVACGGRLWQHVPDDSHKWHGAPSFGSRYHAVNVNADSRLASLIGAGINEVNSRHHQAVLPNMLGRGLIAVATSPDGVVEAIESSDHRFVLGVQWHPERVEVSDRFRTLFEALIEAARTPVAPARR